MADFVCLLPARLRRYVATGQRDARGNVVAGLAPPEPILVWAWYISEGSVELEGHAGRVSFDATCYPPTSLAITARDEIELPGEGWFQVKLVADYDNNPLWSPGLADVKLRKVNG
ncbi:MAG: hypothetical protein EOP24_27390 [Hyphomicrobiales bacterium]|nr:MAG: hypothetical protein EOP24_27390 [Hyphomicrobiales bacterium]